MRSWYSAYIQETSFIDFSFENSYYPLINKTIHDEYLADSNANCLPVLAKCTSLTGQMEECTAGSNACDAVDERYGEYYPNANSYDIRQKGDGPYFPPESEVPYLQDPKIMKAIGAKVTYTECAEGPIDAFYSTVDSKFLPLTFYLI